MDVAQYICIISGGASSASGSGGFLVAAPTITWSGTVSDNTPDFEIDFAIGVALNDVVRVQRDTSNTFPSPTDATATLDSTAVSGLILNFAGGSVADGTYYYRARVERSSLAITDWSNTATVTIVTASAPVNSVAPAVTGTPAVTNVLTTDNGTWTNTPTGYTYQWQRGGVDIGGATSSTYTLVELDAGTAITCNVTASNASGNATQAGNSTNIDVYVVFLAHIEDTNDAVINGTYSGGVWNGVSLGVAAANRIIAVGWASGPNNCTIASCSVSGVSGTKAIGLIEATGGCGAELWVAAVPTGTTGNLSATLSGSAGRMGGGVWAIYGASGVTASATGSTAADNTPVSITVPARGICVGMGANKPASPSTTWAVLTKRYDLTIEGSTAHSGADYSSHAGGSISPSADYNLGTTCVTVYATWGP